MAIPRGTRRADRDIRRGIASVADRIMVDTEVVDARAGEKVIPGGVLTVSAAASGLSAADVMNAVPEVIALNADRGVLRVHRGRTRARCSSSRSIRTITASTRW